MEQVQLIIAGKDVGAKNSATLPVTTRLPVKKRRAPLLLRWKMPKAAADAAAAAFPKWSAMGPSARRAILNKAAELLEERAGQFATLVMAETGATAGWGHFNIHLAAGMLREAAAMTTQIQGEVVPSDVPGNMAMAIRQPVGVDPRHRAVECADHSRRARGGDAALRAVTPSSSRHRKCARPRTA